jgi:hypothetical protein
VSSAHSDSHKNLWRNRGKRKLKPAEQALCLALGMLLEQDRRIKAAREALGG